MASTERPPQAPTELPADRFLDREESWLRFNERVLRLAESPQLPLLERVRFLAIFASNLDEFFMVRVAGLMRRIATGLAVRSPAGRQPEESLRHTAALARELALEHAHGFAETVLPLLVEQGIEIVRWDGLEPSEQERVHQLFHDRIYPVLTPLVVDPAHPFPYISGQSLNLAVTVTDPRLDITKFARVKVPPVLPRFMEVSPGRFVPLEDVIATHLTQLFPGMEIVQHHAFRVTRNQDLEVDEDVTESLLNTLERELLRRRFGPVVRLEVEQTMPDDVLDRLATELGVAAETVYRLPGPLDLGGLHAIADLDRADLKYPPFRPSEAVLPPGADIFALMREREILVHHPYDSFTTSVERLIEQAAADPRVMAIKQTLYRTSGKSPIVDALIGAAEAGKQVVVAVEIKARFDERANIDWAYKLEQAGCHVMYGVVGLKTHCKLALVVREETDGTLRRYCHIGTGNYHPKTARQYEDLGLLTADPEVGEDVSALFNHLTGYSRYRDFRRVLVAPDSLRSGLVDRVDREIAHHRAGRAARIRFKCNSLTDEAVIDALYRASAAGVPVDVWVRGICALRPGVPGLSETIRVRSVLGRFLEHSRVYIFDDGGDPEVWLGSADLMHRNLDRRVEVLVRVTDERHRADLAALLADGTDDATASWHLTPDGSWPRHPDGTDIQEDADAEAPMNPPEISDAEIHAAGAVLWRPAGAGCEVALVHRPKYDDWTIPKGKVKRREHLLRTARREVYEETGVKPLLGRRLAPSFYDKDGRGKRVDYWAATAEPGRPTATPIETEIDGVAWLSPAEAERRLSYERDRRVLADFADGPYRTVPLILLRHAATAARSDLPAADDALRPLDHTGRIQAASLAKLLSCFGSANALAATTARGTATLVPYATRTRTGITTETVLTPGLAKPGQAEARLDELLADPVPTIVCGDEELVTGLLNLACRRLGRDAPAAPELPEAGFWVLHLDAGRIAAIESHRSPVYAELARPVACPHWTEPAGSDRFGDRHVIPPRHEE